jgi:hypothetical protein
MAGEYLLIAQYPKQQVCLDRQGSALLKWSAYEMAVAIPPEKPDEDWVRQRILAARIPQSLQSYVQRTAAYYQQDPSVIDNIRNHLSQWNDDATEATIAAELDAATSAIMPLLAKQDVTDQQVQDWYTQAGFVSR